MTKQTLAPDFPCKFDMFVHLTNGDQNAVATVSLPPGTLPTRKSVKDMMDQALKQVQSQMGADWRLCTRYEFVGDLFEEKTGMRDFAIPGPDKWSDEVKP